MNVSSTLIIGMVFTFANPVMQAFSYPWAGRLSAVFGMIFIVISIVNTSKEEIKNK